MLHRIMRYLTPVVMASAVGACISQTPVNAATNAVTQIQKLAPLQVAEILKFYFCETTACKNVHTAQAPRVATDLVNLQKEASAVTLSNNKLAPIASLLHSDVHFLATAVSNLGKKNTVASALALGEIYFSSGEVSADVYQLSCLAKGAPVEFFQWATGIRALLTTISSDAQALYSPKATAADVNLADQALVVDSNALRAHANGPRSSFNALLVTFAANELFVSQGEIGIYNGTVSTTQRNRIVAVNQKLSPEYGNIVKTMTALAKS